MIAIEAGSCLVIAWKIVSFGKVDAIRRDCNHGLVDDPGKIEERQDFLQSKRQKLSVSMVTAFHGY